MKSFWEKSIENRESDFAIIGAGIVGLSAAIQLKRAHKKSKVFVYDSQSGFDGASSKNAGFACFGSISELYSDFNKMGETEMLALVKKRYQGLELLRKQIGDKALVYENFGGHEIFTNHQLELFEACENFLPRINKMLKPIFGKKAFFSNKIKAEKFDFQDVNYIISSPFESQLHPGKMMHSLGQLALKLGVEIYRNSEVLSFEEVNNKVCLKMKLGEVFCKKLLIANNAFSKNLLPEIDVQPGRAQVLITKPIENLKIKGCFHMKEGYFYFRNVGKRLLFGGGRNLDIAGETTYSTETTSQIQNHLESLLQMHILPNQKYEVDMRWAGVMGLGATKKPIVKLMGKHTACAVRMGGMGVAMGSIIGKEGAILISS